MRRGKILSLEVTRFAALSACLFVFPYHNLSSQEKDATTERIVTVTGSSQSAIKDVEVLAFNGDRGRLLVAKSETSWEYPADTKILVARSPGFRYGGTLISKDSTGDAKIVLTRCDEPARVLKTLPVPISPEDRLKLREEIIDNLFEQFQSAPDFQQQGRLALILAQYDPKRVESFLIEGQSVHPMVRESLSFSLPAALATKEPDAAIELVAETSDPHFQSGALLKVLEALDQDSPLRTSLEDQLLKSVNSISQPQLKYAVLASVAEYFAGRGESEKARTLINANIDAVEKLPSTGWSVYPRSLFAALIVNEDPQRAEQLLAATNGENQQVKRELSRAWARLAFACCHRDPKLAKRFLEKSREFEAKGTIIGYETNVIQWMTVKHPQAAVDLVRNISRPGPKAWTLGIVASRMENHPELARKTLAESVALAIENHRHSKPGYDYLSPASIIAGLLPVAEKIAPEEIESMIWQSVWCSIRTSRFVSGPSQSAGHVQKTAAAIRRYDRAIATALYGDRPVDFKTGIDGSVDCILAFTPEKLMEHLKIVNQSSFGRRYSADETALKMLSENDSSFWDEISLPAWLAHWPADTFEDR